MILCFIATTEEWIEIFNKNDFNVDLSGWKIKDSIGSITTYTFPKEIIEAQSYLVLLRPETKITLNNDADILNLIQPNGIVTDTTSYDKAPRNQSFNLTSSGWSWSEELTPKTPNIIKQTQEQGFEKLILKSSDNKAEKNDIMKDDENMLATVGKQISEPNESSNIYLIALTLALFSGIAILILKKTIKKTGLIFKEK
ncbi:MAG TPA: lamin tail domain-containing protein [bacterium]|nr:lamin tail domain-containing protein [bacterium]